MPTPMEKSDTPRSTPLWKVMSRPCWDVSSNATRPASPAPIRAKPRQSFPSASHSRAGNIRHSANSTLTNQDTPFQVRVFMVFQAWTSTRLRKKPVVLTFW